MSRVQIPSVAPFSLRVPARSCASTQGSRRVLREARAATVKKSGVAWKDNGLRHSFVSFRLADTQNAPQVALEAGNSPQVVFRHYRELVKPESAKTYFAISPEQPANVLTLATAKAAQ